MDDKGNWETEEEGEREKERCAGVWITEK